MGQKLNRVIAVGGVAAAATAGIVAITAIGVVAFGDRLNVMQVACIALILIGATGLQMAGGTAH